MIDLLTSKIVQSALEKALVVYNIDKLNENDIVGIVMRVLDDPQFHVVLNCSTNEGIHET